MVTEEINLCRVPTSHIHALSWFVEPKYLLWLKENPLTPSSARLTQSSNPFSAPPAISCFLPAFVFRRGEGDGQTITATAAWTKELDRSEPWVGFLFSLAPLMQIFFFLSFLHSFLRHLIRFPMKFSPMAHHEITATRFAHPSPHGTGFCLISA